MPIPLDEPRAAGSPVLRRRQIGEQFAGGVLKFEQRDMLKEDKPQFKENGKARQELVVQLLTFGGDMAAGLGDNIAVPPRGVIVRAILKGGAFGDWIDAKNLFTSEAGRTLQVGDRFYMNTTHAIRYQSTGSHAELGTITDPNELAHYYANSQEYRDRRESLGFRGELKLRAATPEEGPFVLECEAAYATLSQQAIALDEPQGYQQAPPPPAAPLAQQWQAPPQAPAPAPAQQWQPPAQQAPPAPTQATAPAPAPAPLSDLI